MKPHFANFKIAYKLGLRQLYRHRKFNPLSANPTKWSNTLKQFDANLTTDCLSVFDHFFQHVT